MRRWMLFAATGAMLTFMLAMAGVALAQEDQYEAKDPFRQLVEPADADTSATTGGDTTGGDEAADEGGGGSGGGDIGGGGESGSGGDTIGGGSGGRDIGGGGDDGSAVDDGGAGGSTSGGAGRQGIDSDNDGVSDRRENQLGLDPMNPDTDGDGIPDGAGDSNGDGRTDGPGGRGGGQGSGSGDGADDSNPPQQQSIDSTTGEVPQATAPEQTGDCSDPTFAAINPGICGTTGVNPVLDADDNYSQGVVVGDDTPDCATPEQVLPSGLCAEAPTVTSEQYTPAISMLPDTGGTALHLLPAAGLLLMTGLIGMRLVRRS